MIPVCVRADAVLANGDGLAVRLEACDPARPDPGRVYLVLGEMLAMMQRDCGARGVPGPVALERLPASAMPRPLAGFWRDPRPGPARVCLVNGAGGGIGDGIMMAPALEFALERMRGAAGAEVEFDVYSMCPARSAAALRGIAGLRVRSLPLSLAEFCGYDYYADFSGMMTDPDSRRLHMTDHALGMLGLEAAAVPAAAKRPRLRLAPMDPGLGREILALRRRAAGRPLVAMVYTATRTRSLPDDLAAGLFARLSRWALPVALTPDARASAGFLAERGLAGVVADLSPLSRSIAEYFSILAAMDAVVSVDTSALHAASALGRPVVALFNSIDHRLRVRYHQGVTVLQAGYAGRRCKAPCGLSKMRFVMGGRDGRPLFDLGCACPEALDLDRLEAEMREMLDAGRPPEEVRAAFAPAFQASRAPCWSGIDPDLVDSAAQKILASARAEHGRAAEAWHHVGTE